MPDYNRQKRGFSGGIAFFYGDIASFNRFSAVKKETYLSSECHREAHAEEHFAAPEMMIEAGTNLKTSYKRA